MTGPLDRYAHRKRFRFAIVAVGLLLLNGIASPGRADDPPQPLTPEQRQELAKQAIESYQAGFQLYQRGEVGLAIDRTREALQIHERLYPRSEFPQGHPDLANNLNNLGALLQAQGVSGEARGYYERALAMRQALYPKEQHPRGHPDLANSLNNLGSLLQNQGGSGEARGYYERALAMRHALYPKEQYPRGHPELAQSLDSLDFLLQVQGDYGEAQGYHERALAMNQALYPKEQYPQGHPALADSLNNLGTSLQNQGGYGKARDYYERALAMKHALYPKEQYPRGHPHLVGSLDNLGSLLQAQGAYGEALPVSQQGVDMQQGLADILLAATSEAEAMNYLAQLPLARDFLISVSLHVPESDAAAYARIWRGKATMARMLRRRQAEQFHLASTNPAVGRTIEAWRNTRGELARLLLATADGRDHPERLWRLQHLTAEKERLERDLAGASRSSPAHRSWNEVPIPSSWRRSPSALPSSIW